MSSTWNVTSLRRMVDRRHVGVVLAAACLVVGAGGLLAYFYTPRGSVELGLAAFSPFLMLGAPLALFGFLLLRYWVIGALALVVTLVAISTQWRLFVAAPAYRNGIAVVVMTSNLKLGEADANSVVAAVRRHRVDLLMLQELTPDEQNRLEQAGLNNLLPHHISEPVGGPYGTGLWSRYPLSQTVLRPDFGFAFVTARAKIPGVTGLPVVVAAHMTGPWPKAGQWQKDITHLPGVLRGTDPGVPMIFGADLNSTPDVAQFRRVLAAGFHDAAQQAGAGITRTFPSDAWYPPLIAIDHVLTRDAVGRSAQTVEIRGSDHRALVITVDLPR